MLIYHVSGHTALNDVKW